jgi:nitroimidazol reductase NimA-like FMN-containing flavoprotein (pyridoxamine 5'-phosphate oxidase superfamily)
MASDTIPINTAAINGVLDEALLCHVGYVDDGPVVIPTIHARVDEALYLHGYAGSRLAQLAEHGVRVCVTVTLADGIVLARSQFGHTINHRSVVVRGRGTLVRDPAERAIALTALVEHLLAGRSTHSRPPSDEELQDLGIIRLPMAEAVIETRSGPPVDDPEDLALPHWAGVLGVRSSYGPALPAPELPYGRQIPAQISNYSRAARPQGYR